MNGVRQDLERDLAAELRVAGPVDDAHAAGAELADDLVRADSGAGRESHGWRRLALRSARIDSPATPAIASADSPEDSSMLLRRLPILALTTVLLFTLQAQAARAQSPDAEEPGSREAIAAATTEARFVTPWVAYVPDKPGVPSPTKFLGHIVGAPGELTSTTKIYAYYRALAAATRRVRVEVIGQLRGGPRDPAGGGGRREDASTRPRPTARRWPTLADPRRTDEATAEELIASREAVLPAARRPALDARPARPRC